MKNFLYVSLGGGAGSLLRYIITSPDLVPFSLELLFINIAGSFMIGLFTGAASSKKMNEGLLLFLATGFCGGLTTFSAFAGESYKLAGQSAFSVSLYLISAAFMGLIAAYAGLRLAERKGEE